MYVLIKEKRDDTINIQLKIYFDERMKECVQQELKNAKAILQWQKSIAWWNEVKHASL
jgi:hypothetical protein